MISPDASGCDKDDVRRYPQHLRATIKAIDPVRTVRAILRASEVCAQTYTYRILMAQMPHTEAEELAARLLHDPSPAAFQVPPIDLVLSEAQNDHATPDATIITFDRLDQSRSWSMTPVFTPLPAYNSIDHKLVRPDSFAEVSTQGLRRTATNSAPGTPIDLPPADTTLHLLMVAVDHLGIHFQKDENNNYYNPDRCDPRSAGYDEEACKDVVIQFLLQRMQLAAHSDVAMLLRRDLFLEWLPEGYTDYAMCGSDPDCPLFVAIDRVLWKGDYLERVMLSGKDLASLMSTAEKLNGNNQSLQAQDTFQQWLVTFGMVRPPQPNLTQLGIRSTEFSVMQDRDCQDAQESQHPSAGGNTLYCVNGQPLLADHAYFVSTTDSLAEDDLVYTTVSALPADYRETPKRFLTAGIARTILPPPAPWQPRKLPEEESYQQKRGLFQLDIAKLVLGYSARVPRGGDALVAKSFQGAADSRASTPYQSELDLEGKTRISWNKIESFTVGEQSEVGYDRAVQGNLSGTPVNANYSLNGVTVGPFLQKGLGFLHRHKKGELTQENLAAGSTMFVFAPLQFQRQVVGSNLYFGFSNSPQQQLTVSLPFVHGLAHRAGFRWEAHARSRQKWYLWDRGTYLEAGLQLVTQNNVLSSVTLTTNGNLPFPCLASNTDTIGDCFKKAKYPVDSTTTAARTLRNLHASGFYWDAHFQKALTQLADKGGPGISVIADTKGDAFFRRPVSKALSTQTLYDAPLSIALSFPVLRNLSLAPTYSPFFYGSQITGQHLWVNSFGINVRWYLDRDSGVRGLHQITFKGPASADETKSAKSAK